MSLFKKDHTFETRYDDVLWFEEFFKTYKVEHQTELLKDKVRYHAKMFTREYYAFCEYIGELGLAGVYPILL